MHAASQEANPDSFLVLHIVRRSDNKAPRFEVTPKKDSSPHRHFLYRDDDVEGEVHTFQRRGTEYGGNAKTNYTEMHSAALKCLPPVQPDEMARFETYGENRPELLPTADFPFPLFPQTPYCTQSGFFLYAGTSDRSDPPLYRYLVTSPDGEGEVTGKALTAYTRQMPIYHLPSFLAYQVQVAKVRFLTLKFENDRRNLRANTKEVKHLLDQTPPPGSDRILLLNTLSFEQDKLFRQRYELKRQLNTLSVAEYHLHRLQPEALADNNTVTPHLFSEELDRARSLDAALQTELDYVDPLLERISHVVQRFAVLAQEERNRIAQVVKRQNDERAELREYFGVFLASAGTFWGTMQTTAEFKDTSGSFWWRWPMVWGMAAIAFSGALWAFNRHEPSKLDYDGDLAAWQDAKRKSRRALQCSYAVLLGTVVLFVRAYLLVPSHGWLLANASHVFSSPYFLAVIVTVVAYPVIWVLTSLKARRGNDKKTAIVTNRTTQEAVTQNSRPDAEETTLYEEQYTSRHPQKERYSVEASEPVEVLKTRTP